MERSRWTYRVLALAGALTVLAACTPVQQVQVEQHHRTNNGLLVSRPIVVELPAGGVAGSLAQKDYRISVVRALQARGARIREPGSKPENPVLVSFGYRMSDGQKVIEERQVPEYETYTRKVIRNGQPIILNERRFVGYRRETYTRTVFTAEMQMVMRDGGQADKPVIFEAQAVTAGSCGAMAPLIEPLARAILTEFPGLTGKVRRVNVEIPEC